MKGVGLSYSNSPFFLIGMLAPATDSRWGFSSIFSSWLKKVFLRQSLALYRKLVGDHQGPLTMCPEVKVKKGLVLVSGPSNSELLLWMRSLGPLQTQSAGWRAGRLQKCAVMTASLLLLTHRRGGGHTLMPLIRSLRGVPWWGWALGSEDWPATASGRSRVWAAPHRSLRLTDCT